MYQVNIKVQLELLDKYNDIDESWIEEAIQDSLLSAEGEKITKFLVASFPILEVKPTREKPPPKPPELSNKTTITSQDSAPEYPFFAESNWDGRNNT
tara:strand:- start:893 stop:1183 length:291 start_codon:yes stop_codon:yes gene_type:complete